MLSAAGLDAQEKRRAEFYLAYLLGGLSPANLVLTNPAVIWSFPRILTPRPKWAFRNLRNVRIPSLRMRVERGSFFGGCETQPCDYV